MVTAVLFATGGESISIAERGVDPGVDCGHSTPISDRNICWVGGICPALAVARGSMGVANVSAVANPIVGIAIGISKRAGARGLASVLKGRRTAHTRS